MLIIFLFIQSTVFSSPAHAAFQLAEERLSEPGIAAQLQGKKIGILSHAASRDRNGQHIVDRLMNLEGAELKMIFAPEHGYRSVEDDHVTDTIDSVTGLPVYSLYGSRKAPTPDMLAQLDLVVIDLQDVGLRYYTYPATVAYTLKACAEANVPVILLDRPNPLGGMQVEGAVLEKKLVQGGLTNLAPIPTRHGMTLGELAIYLNRTLHLHADLTVIPMLDWHRTMEWDDTGLPWLAPSPALTTSNQAFLYSIFGAMESGGFAVGRGVTNELAFSVFGSPKVDVSMQDDLMDALAEVNVNGLRIERYSWIPDRAIYVGRLCRGFKVSLSDHHLQSFATLIKVLQKIHDVIGNLIDLKSMTGMLGATWVVDGILQDQPIGDLVQKSVDESEVFMLERSRALLYRP